MLRLFKALMLLALATGFAAASAQNLLPDLAGGETSAIAAEYAKAMATRNSAAPKDKVEIASVPPADIKANERSDVFGTRLFTGYFANQGPVQFNSDYSIAVGDKVQIRLWGGFEYDTTLVVDPQGNVFVPNLGPLKLQGVRNADLQRVVESAVRKVFRANVQCYASLAAAQAVRVYVGGFVSRPGLYQGTSMDSLLHYLDQAGGIDAERGSFLAVQIKRAGAVRSEINLYDFLLKGEMPLVQFADGDVIFVTPRQNVVKVDGLVENAKRFEFSKGRFSVAELAELARPRADATHVRVVRNTGAVRNTEYYALEQASSVVLQNGDELEFTADKKPGTISVRVEGEHISAQEYVLPYGARLGELIHRIQLTPRSDIESLQLYRPSVRLRQKALLNTSLRSLETAALTARSGTSDEARLRKEEADLLLQWIERAKKIEPAGQVMIAQSKERDELSLENGDVLRIPPRDGLVLVSGEVMFPNAIAFDSVLNTSDYIQRAGGYTQNADVSRLIVAHRDGSYSEGGTSSGWFGSSSRNVEMRPGDEVLVLPRIDVKSRQIAKDLTQILYQMAVSAKIVFGL
ncbi:MAG: polysaccharide biosynthesis/export family protein [Candidatus Dactylopiibacterium sp.]|nr:polysaccharide biosynthesis/export family protein [Candidatus Dactylopiibacterium sp.]